ncbi:hypothetical protein [Rugamonas sp. DEMB1]|uniref:hypothetical protein n=1 Tax=Rugamonas sp. DEMB1 TaxID=3039386 RepID=UPI00244C24B9|nr:hypothetical protein [Rugamonas sp. DEMB1]WGG48938.1 hypothetical protein QC826_20135 [Rugamonas sp. DEMB1]
MNATLHRCSPHGCWLAAGLQGLQAFSAYARIYRDVYFVRFFSSHVNGETLHTLHTLLRVSVDAGCGDAGLKTKYAQPCMSS